MKVIAYHGSGVEIDEFNYQFTNLGNDQLGSGFYFSSNFDDAVRYCSATLSCIPGKLGGFNNPTVHKVELSFDNLLDSTSTIGMKKSWAKKIIESAPSLEETLENWGELEIEGKHKLIEIASEAYVTYNGEIEFIKSLNKIANDFYGNDIEGFNRVVKKTTQFDGVFHQFDVDRHYVAWFPEQIRFLERIPLHEINKKKRILK